MTHVSLRTATDRGTGLHVSYSAADGDHGACSVKARGIEAESANSCKWRFLRDNDNFNSQFCTASLSAACY